MKYLVGSLVLLSSFVNAETWLTSSNKMAKNDLQFLSSRSIITTPVTTFPIVWETIIPQLRSATALTTAEQDAVNRLLREYQLANRIQVQARVSTDEYALPANPDRQRDDASLSVSASYSSDKVKAKIAADAVNGDLSGSYVALQHSGWLFYLSQQEQFWGPGNDASLMYSDYAESIPAIGVQRAEAKPFELPILNLLGPWSFKAQMAELESNRAVSDAKLWSSRFNFKPVNYLEIGLSHAALWGGEGFGNGIDDFFDVISGKEYCVNGAANCDHSLMTKFGNQLAGIDFNLHLNIMGTNVNLYAQTVGEDAPTSSPLPADKVNMFGISSHFATGLGLFKVYFETIDSNLSCGTDKNVNNCFYEHTVYQNGYRYKQLPLGSQYDNDSTSYVLGLTLSNDSHFAVAKLKQLNLNEDSSDITTITGAGGHYLVAEKTDLTLFEYSHQYDWSENQRVSFELQSKLKGSLPNNDDHIIQVLYQHYF